MWNPIDEHASLVAVSNVSCAAVGHISDRGVEVSSWWFWYLLQGPGLDLSTCMYNNYYLSPMNTFNYVDRWVEGLTFLIVVCILLLFMYIIKWSYSVLSVEPMLKRLFSARFTPTTSFQSGTHSGIGIYMPIQYVYHCLHNEKALKCKSLANCACGTAVDGAGLMRLPMLVARRESDTGLATAIDSMRDSIHALRCGFLCLQDTQSKQPGRG